MSRRPAPVLPLACVALLTVGLAACVPEPATPSPSSSTGTTPSGSASAATPTPTTSGSGTPSAPAVDPAACLPGTWTMDQAGLDGYYGDVNALVQGSGLAFTPSGSAVLTLADDGTFSWAPSTQISAAVSGTTVLIAISGRTDGTYTAAGDRLTAASSTDGLVITATINGASTDPGPVSDQIAAAPVTDAAFTCTPDTLTLQTSIAGGTATSILHR